MKAIKQIYDYCDEASEYVKDMKFHNIQKNPEDLPASGIPCLCDVTIDGKRSITTLYWTVLNNSWSKENITVHRWAYKKLKHH